MGVDLAPVIETVEETKSDDPIFTHIIRGNKRQSGSAILMEAMVNGTPVTAICGYTWVPFRDPKKYPLCRKCQEIFEFEKQF